MSSKILSGDALQSGAANALKATSHVALAMPPLADLRSEGCPTLVSQPVLRGSIRAFEFLITVLTGLAVALSYVAEPELLSQPTYPTALIATGIATVLTFELFGLYTLTACSTVLRSLPRIAMAWTVAFAMLVAGVFFMKHGSEFSRVWLALWFVAGGVALAAGRLGLAALLHRFARQGRLYRRAVIYGSGEVTEAMIRELEGSAQSELRISGIFDDRDGERTPALIAGYPRLGGLDDLVNFCRKTRIDLVIVALPLTAEHRLADVLKHISVLPADIKMPAASTSLRFSPRTYSRIGDVAMIDLHDAPIADWGRVSKWVFDKTIGTIALVLLAPLMAVVAAAIKLDSRGPVLFRQKRYGFNNELIEVLKFRSMYTDRCDTAAARLVTRDDPRVTRVGRFIRRTSLDELPQLINVVMGDLSLVGPRPHALAAKAANQLYDEVVEGYFARHKVKPGITGWAQINGWRGETDTSEKITKRVEHDLYYIENWSVFLDLYILLKTPFALLKTENAY